MNKINIMRLAGLLLLAIGILSFLYGLMAWNKFAQATGFMSFLVSVTLLYYTSQVTMIKKE